ncbi:hypothetical protein BN159_0991 [Streptomyces davaonensis JCM 4913]|uniref:HTH gntR-type domain-containing protein n=1 Tax=Streptomyces davaonensis (strain DSM 101723 / JCM 4913 / KCC S-0913 / 768) TaxID=1214101 RepID=K4QX27_STRDJ|nr:winged helix-turn-helix domain-containing protein [Streptomyces davaonensis]CCK25370.1 hypothetical protein BN159_0991 [Streptomyces davaonensis JCM 4913]
MIDRLRQIITDAGAEAGPEELADILWLAGVMTARTGTGTRTDRPERVHEPEPTPPPTTPPPPPPPSTRTTRTASGTSSSLFTAEQPHAARSGAPRPPRPRSSRRGTPVCVSRAASLDDPLAVLRALRPLGRRRLADNRMELDEEATAEAGIDHQMLMPIVRPARDPWLDLTLVVDTHRSMLLWHDLISELRTLLTHTGLFRSVRVWFLRASAEAGITVSPTLGGPPRSPGELVTGHRHSLILLVSDTVSEAWQRPALRAAVGQWCRHSAVALLNVLPERLWERGGVRPVPCQVRATGPAAPNVTWSLGVSPHELAVPRAALPVVDASPAALSALASLVSGSGRPHRLPCLPLDAAWSSGEAPGDPRLGPEPDTAPDEAALRAVRWFEESASPGARELAGFLAAVPLTLPVMNLVRRAMLPQSDHGHLAEVALGGLLQPWETYDRADPTYLEFRFLPGVRDALLGGRLRREITAVRELVREEVAAYLDEHRGPGDFPALRHSDTGVGTHEIDPEALPFALTTRPVPTDDPRRRPTYLAIAETLREEIAAGNPPVGEKLPTQVRLAVRFGVSTGTVQRALRELAAAGLVRSRRGSPATVIARLPRPAPSVGPVGELPRRDSGLGDAVHRAFQDPEVTIDAVVGDAAPLLVALRPQVARVRDGVVRPTSIRVRLLLMGGGGTHDMETLREQLAEAHQLPGGVAIDVRTAANQPPTELYLLNNRTVLTSYVHLPGETPEPLLVQPDDRLEETRAWFDSWWELYGER